MNYSEIWVFFGVFPNIKILREGRCCLSSYRCLQLICVKKAFSVLLRSNKKKLILIDSLMRGGIKKKLTPRDGHIAETMQEQASH